MVHSKVLYSTLGKDVFFSWGIQGICVWHTEARAAKSLSLGGEGRSPIYLVQQKLTEKYPMILTGCGIPMLLDKKGVGKVC